MRNQKLIFLWVLLVSFPHLSMTSSWDEFGILSGEDIYLAQRQDEPAAQSPLDAEPRWEAFNQWACFSSDTVDLGCYNSETGNKFIGSVQDVKSDEGSYFPVLYVEKEEILSSFESFGPIDLDHCLEEIQQWRQILEGQHCFCAFAAQLPPTEGDNGVENWVLYGLKTKFGRIMAPVYDEVENEEGEAPEIESMPFESQYLSTQFKSRTFLSFSSTTFISSTES